MVGRKWSLLLSLVFVLGFVDQSMAAYTLDYFFVQHRVYEDGRNLNRIAFGIKNARGQYVATDQLKSVTLTDPLGHAVPLTKADLKFAKYSELDGEYDGKSGVFLYGKWYTASNYWGEVPGRLVIGTYHLSVRYATSVCNMDFNFEGAVKLPVTAVSSIESSVDGYGNLTATWDVPMDLCRTKPTLQTSVRAYIDVYQDAAWKGELYVRIPTHMGRLFVPKVLVDRLRSTGNKYYMAIQLRTNNNCNRTYSLSKRISLAVGGEDSGIAGEEFAEGGER